MKRVILCLDGTWNNNKPGPARTNVAKLCDYILPVDKNGVRQSLHYVDGIASVDGEWFQFLRGALGFGVAERIATAYGKLAADYTPGDEIFLFGFSRGAFEARWLSGLISYFGIAKNASDYPIDEAWAIYRKREKKRDVERVAALRAMAHYPVRIKCVGVWDTVGNLGNPLFGGPLSGDLKFHDTRPAEAVEVGLHALSIDETRGPFRPTLWSMPDGHPLPAGQHIEQVWFAGSHCNVGGGFREIALSDIGLTWMIERAGTTTSLAFDTERLAKTTRPDALGPQHSPATGALYVWSGIFPFIRLVKQSIAAIPEWRLARLGTWRTGKLPAGEVSINESVHDSVVKRYGQKVIELKQGRGHIVTYEPASLKGVIDKAPTAMPPLSDKPRRVKIFTVHGTFAHNAEWDDWDAKDDPGKKPEERQFINRLSGSLAERNIVLQAEDHSQFEWSGGNSHDERRTAAIGLKKTIEDDLCKSYEKHGKNYYDGGVYVIGHSHGGTVARLAMNLWDKDFDYYDPADEKEFAHDDTCQTCMRARNGKVGPNTALRPSGVITFGSPFVNFEERRGGLLTAKLGVWVLRIMLASIAFLLIFPWPLFGRIGESIKFASLAPEGSSLRLFVDLLWPLALYWLVASYLPRAILDPIERWTGKGKILMGATIGLVALKYAVMLVAAVYYYAYFTSLWYYGVGSTRVLQWFPFLNNSTVAKYVGWTAAIIVLWLLIVSFPSRFLAWLERKVTALKHKLPMKYDPAEDKPVKYLSYHTPGDEAGFHLRVFGVLTWLVQTFALASASVLLVGAVLIPLMAVLGYFFWPYIFEAAAGELSELSFGTGFVDPAARGVQDKLITTIDWLTFYPSLILSWLFGDEWYATIGGSDHKYIVLLMMPLALLLAILALFFLFMPLTLLALGVTYLVSMWLRGSGYVFGSESMAWTLANRIAVNRRANDNTTLRTLLISPDAWARREMAHCYYYKHGRVIDDLGQQIADWNSLTPNPALPVQRWAAVGGRAAIVTLAVLGIFAAATPIAAGVANIGIDPSKWAWTQPAPNHEQALFEANNSRELAEEKLLAAEEKAFDAEIGRQAAYVEMHRAKGNEDEALATQSRMMASLSDHATAGNDAVGGALYALEGLPADGSPARPLVSEASIAANNAKLALRERMLLAAHKGAVSRAAYSPDGSRIVTGGADGMGHIWDAKTGAELASLQHEGDGGAGLGVVALSPDGKRILTTRGPSIYLWDASGAAQGKLQGHSGHIKSAEFSPDGAKVISVGLDKAARIWDTATGKELAIFKGSVKPAEAKDSSSGSRSGSTEEAAPKEEFWDIGSASFSPDGKVLAWTDGKDVRLWDASTAKEIGSLKHEAELGEVAFSPDGSKLATATADNALRIWNWSSGKLLATMSGHREMVQQIFFLPDGAQVLTMAGDGTVRLWDVKTGGEKKQVRNFGASSNDIAVGAGKVGVAYGSWSSGAYAEVKVWEADTLNEFATLKRFEKYATVVAFSPGGASILTGSGDGTVRIWDTTPSPPATPLGSASAAIAVFSPDGARAVTATTDGTGTVWDTATAAAAAKLNGFTGKPQDALLAPDGGVTLLLSEGSVVNVWSSVSRSVKATLKGHEKDVRRAKFSKDGARILTWSDDRSARVWDSVSGAQVGMRALEHDVNDGAFSADGKRVATIGDEPVARIWDAETGNELLAIDGLWEPNSFWGGSGLVAFAPDGRLIIAVQNRAWIHDGATGTRISALRDGTDTIKAIAVAEGGGFAALAADTALLVDLASNTVVASLKQQGSVDHVALTADAKDLLTIPWGHSAANLWHLQPQTKELVTDLQSAVPRCLTGKQRARAYLPPEPPRWCIEQGKWPYRGAAWKEWLAARDAGQKPPLPAE